MAPHSDLVAARETVQHALDQLLRHGEQSAFTSGGSALDALVARLEQAEAGWDAARHIWLDERQAAEAALKSMEAERDACSELHHRAEQGWADTRAELDALVARLERAEAERDRYKLMAERGQDAETEKIERGTRIADLEAALKNMEAERDTWERRCEQAWAKVDEASAEAMLANRKAAALRAEVDVWRNEAARRNELLTEMHQQRDTLAELLRHIQSVIRTVAPAHPLLEEIDHALGSLLVLVDPSDPSLAVPRFKDKT